MKVTINDIAKAANVAKSTVSKVLNDAPTISEETKRKVREIMKQMNYTPSSIATQLAKQSSFNIGLLVDMSKQIEFLNHFFYNIIGGIESIIGPLKYELTISNVQHTEPEHNFMNRLVLSKRIDGLITNNSIMTDPIAEELNRLQFPFVLMGECGNVPLSWVDIDNTSGGRMIAQHLIDVGCKRVAFVGGVDQESLFTKRYTGVRQALEQAGLEVREEWRKCGNSDAQNGYKFTTELLTSSTPPDAIICMDNYVAFGALKATRTLGLRIPRDMRIATFDNYPLAPYSSPPLTCLNIDTFELGVTAGDMLMDRINDPSAPHQSKLLQPELIIRESTIGE